MKVKSTFRRHLLLAASSLLVASHAQDQDGSWLGDSAGDWTDGTKWTDGLIANGADFTATFGNVITAARTITLNGNRTIGNITAADTGQNYTLTGNTLTLDRTIGVPTVEVVSSRDLTIESIIGGDDGLQKSGGGTLSLKGTNTFSGGLTIKAGTVRNNNAGSGGNFLGTGDITIGEAANTGAAVALSFNGSSASFISTNPISVVGTGNATISISGGNMIFSFFRDQDSIDPKTALSIEVCTDLVNWNTAPSPYAVPDVDTGGVINPGVTVDADNPAIGTDKVTLTVAQTPDAKKFARLKVVITP